MTLLGLDIGTTTVSAVVALQSGETLAHRTVAHNAFLQGAPYERIQDAEKLVSLAEALAQELAGEWSPDAIGVTGQMHGMVYLGKSGEILSPLFTWQDGRGDLISEGESLAARLSRLTGRELASGYGLVTHAFQTAHGLVPPGACRLATIHDVVAMRLAGRQTPVTDPGDAQSLGFFDLRTMDFDRPALESVGMESSILPAIGSGMLGVGPLGVPVAIAIGDNQASFLGATDGDKGAVLLNIGTGSQMSVWSPSPVPVAGLETRPYPLGGALLVGASLAGGRAWAMLERFFRACGQHLGGPEQDIYAMMSRLAEQATEALPVDTAFSGTRRQPEKRGAICGISENNFTPEALCRGFLEGMVRELYDFYRLAGVAADHVIGSGNAMRLTPPLGKAAESIFGLPFRLSLHAEEAARGAALYAGELLK